MGGARSPVLRLHADGRALDGAVHRRRSIDGSVHVPVGQPIHISVVRRLPALLQHQQLTLQLWRHAQAAKLVDRRTPPGARIAILAINKATW